MRDAHARIDALLLARALEGLSPAETRELEALLAAHPDIDATVYDFAAAAVSLAAAASLPPMPEGLRAALEERAAEFIAENRRRTAG